MPYESRDLFTKEADSVKEKKLVLIPSEFTGGKEITGNVKACTDDRGKTQSLSCDSLSPDATVLITELFRDYDTETLASETASATDYCRHISMSDKETPFDRLLADKVVGIIREACGSARGTDCPQADRFKLREEIMEASLYSGIVYENTQRNKQNQI